MKINLGTSGWYYEDWVDAFYPEKMEKSDWLSYYADRFNTVEVNASFYRLPFENMVKGWKRKTPDDFLLTFKGSKVVTHRKKLNDVKDYLDRFFSRVKLAEKIGVILWQLPPNIKKDLSRLEQFLALLDSDLRQCVEFRHDSWFEQDTYDLLEKYDVGFCMISAPNLPSPLRVTSDFAYIRWHGLDDWYKYDYSKQELSKWADVIKNLEVDEVFGYFNNDYQAFAPKNCSQLLELLK